MRGGDAKGLEAVDGGKRRARNLGDDDGLHASTSTASGKMVW
jgi:hypothetical protein